MNTASCRRGLIRPISVWVGLWLLTAGYQAPARVLDDFNDNTKTAWDEFVFQPGMGTITEAGGQFKIQVPAVGQPLFAAATKTSETFTLQEGRTLEFRVDMVSGEGKDSFAILSWIPTAEKVSSLAGYSLAKSSTDVLVVKGLNKYFYNENPTPAIKNENVTLVLSLTGSGGNVIVTTKVLDKDNHNEVLFEKTFTDTPAADVLADGTDSPAAPYLGSGHFVLMCYADYAAGGPAVYEVVLDNAQAFVLDNIVVDDFKDGVKTDWSEFTFQPGLGTVTETNGQITIGVPAVGQPLFAAATKTSRTFELADGEMLQFKVDLISGNDPRAFAILSWLPTSQKVADLAGYSMVMSSTEIIVAKGLNKYFIDDDKLDPPIKSENVTLVLTLTGVGTDVVINARVLDKANQNAVLYDKTFIDTPAADILGAGTDSPAAPFLGVGNYVLMGYGNYKAGGPAVYEVTMANARASAAPQAGNQPPVISEVSPEENANFLPASTQVSFKIADDKPLADGKITVALNGTVFSSANGLTLAGSGNNRTATLGGLKENVNYAAVLQVVDADGATNAVSLFFDTFSPGNFVVETEDYNFGGGQYINNPVVIAESALPQANAYHGQAGAAEVDFKDERQAANNYPYRLDDPVGTKRSLDIVRKKFADAGGAAGEMYDYDVGDIRAAEWLNYTRTFAAGSYEVYLRESLFNGDHAEAVLEKVTGDPTVPNQATQVLGSFFGVSSGTKYRTIPLTDGLGKTHVVVRLSGKVTLRLRQVTADPADGNIYQNYLVFVPVADTGVQRAAVSGVSPMAGAIVETVSPAISVSIQNRDTTVKTDSIVLWLNGATVAPTITGTPTGVQLSCAITPLPAADTTNAARVVFQDSQEVWQTNDWTFVITYKSMNPASRQDGPGLDPGLKVRVVQAPAGSNLENSLLRAEQQLAANSTIPAYYTNNSVAKVINFSQTEGGADGYFPDDILIPGLLPDENGNDDIAMEIQTYLELAAGLYRFGVRCDDGYEIIAGTSLTDTTTPPIAYHNGGPADETFDFVVAKSGFYPFRMIWYERGGSAYVEWFSVNPSTGDRILINDRNSAQAIKAYVSVAAPKLQVASAAQVAGPYAVETAATIDSAAGTVTIPINGQVRFYRLVFPGTTASKITRIVVLGQSVVIGY